MISKIEAQIKVARGATYLDRVRPGWYNEIDVKTLEINDCHECVVGQLTKGWHPSKLGILGDEVISYGFNLFEPGWPEFFAMGGTSAEWYQPLQDAWLTAIETRKLMETSKAEHEELAMCC